MIKFIKEPSFLLNEKPNISSDGRFLGTVVGDGHKWLEATLEFSTIGELLYLINEQPNKIINWEVDNIKFTSINYDINYDLWTASFTYDYAKHLG